MAKRIIKILAGLVLAAVLLIPGVALLVDDETLSALLENTPGLAPYKDPIVTTKKDIGDTFADYLGDAFAGLDAVYMDLIGPSSSSNAASKVVIDLNAPQPKGAIRPPQKPEVAAPPPQAPQAMAPPPAPQTSGDDFRAKVEKAQPPEVKVPIQKQTAKKAQAPVTRKISKPAKPVADASAEQDHKRGLLFYKGIGVDKDFKKAVQWFKQAAKKGHSGAQYNLGIMSYLGQGMTKDFAQAAHWFQKAGEQDHASAQYNLGFLYYEGKGVTKDDLQAFMWIDRSANLGDEKAVRARETLQKALPKEIFNQ